MLGGVGSSPRDDRLMDSSDGVLLCLSNASHPGLGEGPRSFNKYALNTYKWQALFSLWVYSREYTGQKPCPHYHSSGNLQVDKSMNE